MVTSLPPVASLPDAAALPKPRTSNSKAASPAFPVVCFFYVRGYLWSPFQSVQPASPSSVLARSSGFPAAADTQVLYDAMQALF